MFSEATRGLIYRVVVALLGAAVLYGFINSEQEAAITALVGALSALLASFNTSIKKDGGE